MYKEFNINHNRMGGDNEVRLFGGLEGSMSVGVDWRALVED